MNNYEETLKYLASFVDLEKTGFDGLKNGFDLGRLYRVLEKAENPHRDYRSVHVAGTKGKGSICTFVSSILCRAGYKTGLFTSPHLVSAAERIQINGNNIKQKDLCDTVNRLRGYMDPADAGKFTLFEIYTLTAILYFSLMRVDFAVFEVGMGGRLDATNVIDAEVCGISPVSYDHTGILGSRIEQIAREKAAIIKPGTHCVSSPQCGAVLCVIADKCAKENVSLSVVEKNITYHINSFDENGTCADIHGEKTDYGNCRISMPGLFQVSNCAAAVGICERLFSDGKAGKDTVTDGIEEAFIPGRMEILRRSPFIVIDGAQNADSAEKLRYSVEKIFKYDKLILLLGLSNDKDIKNVCRYLIPIADEIILSRASVLRAADPHLIRGYIKGRRVRVTGNSAEALGTAFHLATEKDMILATGSFFLISEIRQMVGAGFPRPEIKL